MSTAAPIVIRRAGTAPQPPERVNPQHGGPRPGSGRKRAEVEAAVNAAVNAGIVGGDEAPESDLSPDELVFVDYATARARKESAAAAMAELQYKIKSREYVARAAVQTAVASAMAAMAQTLRSIPDNIERKLGVDPDLAQEIGHLIDEAMDSLADELDRMARDGF